SGSRWGRARWDARRIRSGCARTPPRRAKGARHPRRKENHVRGRGRTPEHPRTPEPGSRGGSARESRPDTGPSGSRSWRHLLVAADDEGADGAVDLFDPKDAISEMCRAAPTKRYPWAVENLHSIQRHI